VIPAFGHETDFTLADLPLADLARPYPNRQRLNWQLLRSVKSGRILSI